jgi:hypothetical protein
MNKDTRHVRRKLVIEIPLQRRFNHAELPELAATLLRAVRIALATVLVAGARVHDDANINVRLEME